ncbi:MAG: (Fe-S)-binding protein, partial [Halobacteriota archaeon]|nr:(Fe-S)-binding protein [Halobacteriota archaeon]
MYYKEECEVCGKCFSECPVVDLSLEDAKNEMIALRGGKKSPILKECASCFTCNLVCKSHANPMDLISEFRKREYDKNGLPGIAKLTIPKYPQNMYGLASELLSDEERKTLRLWEAPENSNELVLPGCAVSYMTQYLSKTSLFDGSIFAGGTEFCCGEVYYQMGYLDKFNEIGEDLYEKFSNLGAERLITMCVGCHHAYKHHPGIVKNFEVVHYLDVVWDRLKEEALKIEKNLDMTVTYHDPCTCKEFKSMIETPRKILDLLGVEVVEMTNNREKALCCGMGAGAGSFNMQKIQMIASRRADEAAETGAEFLVTSCGGCSMSLSGHARKRGMRTYRLIEMIQMAMGEEIAKGRGEKSKRIQSNMMDKVMRSKEFRG